MRRSSATSAVCAIAAATARCAIAGFHPSPASAAFACVHRIAASSLPIAGSASSRPLRVAPQRRPPHSHAMAGDRRRAAARAHVGAELRALRRRTGDACPSRAVQGKAPVMRSRVAGLVGGCGE
jgi:hypothetical protein